MKINLHIERLVLEEGLPVTTAQRSQVQRAVAAELGSLLASGGLSQELRGGVVVPRIRSGAIFLRRDSHPGKVGTEIARAVHQGIGRKA
jgi:hypothetical protein